MIRKSDFSVFGSPINLSDKSEQILVYLAFTSAVVVKATEWNNKLLKLKRDIMYAVTLLETNNIYSYLVRYCILELTPVNN